MIKESKLLILFNAYVIGGIVAIMGYLILVAWGVMNLFVFRAALAYSFGVVVSNHVLGYKWHSGLLVPDNETVDTLDVLVTMVVLLSFPLSLLGHILGVIYGLIVCFYRRNRK